MADPKQQLAVIVESQRETFLSVAAEKDVNFEREAQFALQILNASEYVGKVALNNTPSLIAAVNNVAAFGLSLNPSRKLAYLVPRKNAICLDISYIGLMHVAQVSGAIFWGQAVIVRKADRFMLRGIDKEPMHEYDPFLEADQRGAIVGCYCIVKSRDGDYLTHTMTTAQVNAIRDRSDAYKGWLKDNSKACPWISDYEEMMKKTVVKQGAKYWPRRDNDRLDDAIQHINVDEGITFEHAHEAPAEIKQPQRSAPKAEPQGEVIEGQATVVPEQKPAQQSGEAPPADPLPESMKKVLLAKLEAAGLSTEDLQKKFGKTFDQITKADFNAVQQWTKNPMGE